MSRCKVILLPFLSYLTLKNIVTLKSGLDVTQGHSKWYYLKAWVRFPIHLLQYLWREFRDKARYWSKIVIFLYPLNSTPH